MKPKVVWTTREWRELAGWFVSHNISPKDYGFLKRLGEAQDTVLPSDRRRAMVGLPKEVRTRMIEEVATFKAGQSTAEALAKKFSKSESEPPSASKLSTEDLLVELARRIAKFLEPRPEPVALAVDRGFHPKHDPSPPHAQKPVSLQVQVVGPRAEQQDRLRQAAPGLKLRFTLAEENPKLVEERGRSCVETILWTKFMNHAQQESAKRAGQVWYANGLEEIEARLRSLHG